MILRFELDVDKLWPGLFGDDDHKKDAIRNIARELENTDRLPRLNSVLIGRFAVGAVRNIEVTGNILSGEIHWNTNKVKIEEV